MKIRTLAYKIVERKLIKTFIPIAISIVKMFLLTDRYFHQLSFATTVAGSPNL